MELKDLKDVSYHPIQEKLLHILRTRTQNLESDLYFRLLSCFFMAQMASNMRVSLVTPHRGTLPINLFVLGLMESGGGKGHSQNILEDLLFKGFKEVFMQHTFHSVAEQNILTEARKRAVIKQTDEQTEIDELTKEFMSCGKHPTYVFDSGSAPAYKQIRNKFQIADIGALTMVCDEIGTNLLSNAELFAVNLEAYDVGKIKPKIKMNSNDNKRGEERDTPVPSNMLIFGTPTKLFNGSTEEREFYSLLETGYARRLLYGFGQKTQDKQLTAEEMFDILTNTTDDAEIAQLAAYFENLADGINYNKEIHMPKPVALINIQYQLNCEAEAAKLSAFDSIRKAEMQHRFFKAMKLAGAFAFIDGSLEVTEDQMYAAIKLVEDSAEAFGKILTRDKPYARLAQYIAAQRGKSLTHADLAEELPFYPGSKGPREDMLQLAIAWGYRNNVIIKKSFDNTIEFFQGETLQETDINKLLISYSNHEAYNYLDGEIPFDKLKFMVQQDGYHWCNHRFKDNHRREDNVIPEFNTIILDVDSGTSLAMAQDILKEYSACYYTTKRHTDLINRFRIIIPLKYHLKMGATEFKEFMQNIYNWLPIQCDEGTAQRSKKWLSHAGGILINTEGTLLDPTPFIPQTSKNETMKKDRQDLGNMDKIEAWFAGRMTDGQRNNTMAQFALMLLDSGLSPDEVEDRVYSFNEKFKNKLPKQELRDTVIKSIWSKASLK